MGLQRERRDDLIPNTCRLSPLSLWSPWAAMCGMSRLRGAGYALQHLSQCMRCVVFDHGLPARCHHRGHHPCGYYMIFDHGLPDRCHRQGRRRCWHYMSCFPGSKLSICMSLSCRELASTPRVKTIAWVTIQRMQSRARTTERCRQQPHQEPPT